MKDISATYQRVCTLERGHDGDHVPYHAAPDKDEWGNKEIAHPRCVHVDAMPLETEEERYRVVFQIIDPQMPAAGWHDVVRESDLADCIDQVQGLRQLEREGDDVRNPRIEKAVVKWETYEVPRQAEAAPFA